MGPTKLDARAQTVDFSPDELRGCGPHGQDRREEEEVEIMRSAFAKGLWSFNLVSPTREFNFADLESYRHAWDKSELCCILVPIFMQTA